MIFKYCRRYISSGPPRRRTDRTEVGDESRAASKPRQLTPRTRRFGHHGRGSPQHQCLARLGMPTS
jgi:hypothetical protein